MGRKNFRHCRLSLLFSVCTAFVLLPTGCAGPKAIAPLDRDSNVSIVNYHQPIVPPEHKDYAMHELGRGLLFFELGDYLDSDIRFANACRLMTEIVGDDRETAAVVGKESWKVYKGEPYERATAFFYRGLCRYMQRDYAGALAAFRASLACDAETRTEAQAEVEDFCISHFMAARCYVHLSEPENAEAALRIARQHAGDNPHLAPDQQGNNLNLVIAVGVGPYLRPSSLDSSIKRIECADCLETHIDVYVDGQLLGEAAELTDLCVQAESQDWGEMDSVRLGKSIAKGVVSHIPFVSLASHLIRSEADIRCWHGLPQKYFVFAASISEGTHTIALKCRDAGNDHLPRYDHIWFDFPVGGDSSDVQYFRIHRNGQNHYGLESRPIRNHEEDASDL